MRYPAEARRKGVEGRVFIEFVINEDGSISNTKPLKGIGAGCDEEALRVVANSPAWIPAKQDGKTVRQRMVVPIVFSLGNTALKLDIPKENGTMEEMVVVGQPTKN
jgi:protein TonB